MQPLLFQFRRNFFFENVLIVFQNLLTYIFFQRNQDRMANVVLTSYFLVSLSHVLFHKIVKKGIPFQHNLYNFRLKNAYKNLVCISFYSYIIIELSYSAFLFEIFKGVASKISFIQFFISAHLSLVTLFH